MRKKDLERVFLWCEKNPHDLSALYFYNISETLGTFCDYELVPNGFSRYEHLGVHNNLCELRDITAQKILQNIKGKRI